MKFSISNTNKKFNVLPLILAAGLSLTALSGCDRLGNLTTITPQSPPAATPGPTTSATPAPTDSATPAPVVSASPAPAAVHFSYEGEAGPEHWATLSPAFEACGSGQRQSPINIKQALPAIQFDYKDTTLKLVNNGHTLQVNYPAGSKITVGDHSFDLLQFHFHAASENTLDGKQFPMELHLVHRDSSGKLGVVGVFMEEGSENATFQAILNNLPKEENQEESFSAVTLNAASLLPQNHQYYGFDGSLTTPPCTEGVEWRVLSTPIQVSKAQVDAFLKLFHGGNARPVQPLNGRTVQRSE